MVDWKTQSLVRDISMRLGPLSSLPSCDSGPELTQPAKRRQAGAMSRNVFMRRFLMGPAAWTGGSCAGSSRASVVVAVAVVVFFVVVLVVLVVPVVVVFILVFVVFVFVLVVRARPAFRLIGQVEVELLPG